MWYPLNLLLTLVLSWMHIFFVVLWLGSFFLQITAIFPALPTLSPSARNELLQKVLGRFKDLTLMISTIAVVFGVFLLIDMTWGNLGSLTGGTWGLCVSVGALLGLTAYLKYLLLDYWAIKKSVSVVLTDTTQNVPSGKRSRTMWASAVVQAILLVLAFTLMVVAAQI